MGIDRKADRAASCGNCQMRNGGKRLPCAPHRHARQVYPRGLSPIEAAGRDENSMLRVAGESLIFVGISELLDRTTRHGRPRTYWDRSPRLLPSYRMNHQLQLQMFRDSWVPFANFMLGRRDVAQGEPTRQVWLPLATLRFDCEPLGRRRIAERAAPVPGLYATGWISLYHPQ